MEAIEYAAPTTLQAAVKLMAERGRDARPLVGGSDLIAQLKEGRRKVGLVVDIKRIPEMRVLSFDPQKGLRLGAAVPCVDTSAFDAVKKHYPALGYACRLIGSRQIQNRASVGGNLCNASPAADTPPVLVAYGAVAVIAGPNGERRVPVDDFCTAPGQTVLRPGELLVELQIPVPPAGLGVAYERFIPRNEMDIAVVGVGSAIGLDGRGRASYVRCTLAAVAPIPLRVKAVEEALTGKAIGEAEVELAARLATEAARPISDVRASAEYRKRLVRVLTKRTMQAALEAARGK